MRNHDRTTKALLAIIAIFLGVLVFKSVFVTAPKATAADGVAAGTSQLQNYNQSVQNTGSGDVIAYHTMPVSTIGINAKDKIRAIHTLDSAQSFIVQFDDRVEVYRIDGVNLTAIANQASATGN